MDAFDYHTGDELTRGLQEIPANEEVISQMARASHSPIVVQMSSGRIYIVGKRGKWRSPTKSERSNFP